MPTLKQKAVAKRIIEGLEKGGITSTKDMLAEVGYTKATAGAKQRDILESEGVLQALEDYGFNEDNAKKVVAEILLDGRKKPDTRLRAAQEVFKVHGSYKQPDQKPEQHLHLHIDFDKLDDLQKQQFVISGRINE